MLGAQTSSFLSPEVGGDSKELNPRPSDLKYCPGDDTSYVGTYIYVVEEVIIHTVPNSRNVNRAKQVSNICICGANNVLEH